VTLSYLVVRAMRVVAFLDYGLLVSCHALEGVGLYHLWAGTCQCMRADVTGPHSQLFCFASATDGPAVSNTNTISLHCGACCVLSCRLLLRSAFCCRLPQSTHLPCRSGTVPLAAWCTKGGLALCRDCASVVPGQLQLSAV
jgi:hypothetical protein